MKPTKKQIEKFLKYLDALEIMRWLKIGNQPPDPDLDAVIDWLKENREG